MESHVRSIAKALSWRLLGSTATFALAWIVTQRLSTATFIGVGDALVKVGAYYVHERVWERITFGRAQKRTNEARNRETTLERNAEDSIPVQSVP